MPNFEDANELEGKKFDFFAQLNIDFRRGPHHPTCLSQMTALMRDLLCTNTPAKPTAVAKHWLYSTPEACF
jgi:hypothetical protein